MAKNLISHPILVQIWVPIIFFVDFTSTRCETMLQAITVCNFKKNVRSKLKKMAKNLILDLIKAHWAQIWAGNFFVFFFKKSGKNQTLHIMVSYHHVQYQKKLIRRMGKSDFIWHYPTNVEHPKKVIFLYSGLLFISFSIVIWTLYS